MIHRYEALLWYTMLPTHTRYIANVCFNINRVAMSISKEVVPGGCLGSVGMYQLAALIEAVPRISLSRCTVKMHQRPTL